jgi:hypothetical protein
MRPIRLGLAQYRQRLVLHALPLCFKRRQVPQCTSVALHLLVEVFDTRGMI